MTGWGPTLSESQTEAVEVPFDRRIALTRSRLETFPIEDSDAAMQIFDEQSFAGSLRPGRLWAALRPSNVRASILPPQLGPSLQRGASRPGLKRNATSDGQPISSRLSRGLQRERRLIVDRAPE